MDLHAHGCPRFWAHGVAAECAEVLASLAASAPGSHWLWASRTCWAQV